MADLIDDQLRQCVESYTSITEQLNSFASTKDAEYCELIGARYTLLSAMLSLCQMKEDILKEIQPNNPCYCIGSFVFAPRLFDGQYDLAVITAPNSSTPLKSDDLCTVSWVRPRNKYELKSIGTSLPVSRLNPYSKFSFDKEDIETSNLQPGDLVWARYDDGIWYKAEVCEICNYDFSIVLTPHSRTLHH